MCSMQYFTRSQIRESVSNLLIIVYLHDLDKLLLIKFQGLTTIHSNMLNKLHSCNISCNFVSEG